MPAPTTAEKYAAQMYRQMRGLALFDPSPGQYLEAGQRRRKPRVEIGDLGYMTPEGSFQLLLNVHRSSDDPLQIHGVPRDFEPLERVDRLIDYREERMNTPQYLRSTNGVEVELRANASVPGVGGVTSTFEVEYERGATLAYFDYHETLKALNLDLYADYFEANFQSWLAFAHEQRIPLTLDRIVLVTGCERTRAWATVLSERRSASGSLGIETQTLVPGISLTISIRWSNSNGEQTRCGPSSAELSSIQAGASSEGLQLTDVSSLSNAQSLVALVPDQCLFIKGFRGRSTLRNLRKPYKAAAGPHTLPDNDDDDDAGDIGLTIDPDKSDSDHDYADMIPGSSPAMEQDLLSLALNFTADHYSPACKNGLLLMHDDDLEPYLPKPGDSHYVRWESIDHAWKSLNRRLKTTPPSMLVKTERGWERRPRGALFKTQESGLQVSKQSRSIRNSPLIYIIPWGSHDGILENGRVVEAAHAPRIVRVRSQALHANLQREYGQALLSPVYRNPVGSGAPSDVFPSGFIAFIPPIMSNKQQGGSVEIPGTPRVFLFSPSVWGSFDFNRAIPLTMPNASHDPYGSFRPIWFRRNDGSVGVPLTADTYDCMPDTFAQINLANPVGIGDSTSTQDQDQEQSKAVTKKTKVSLRRLAKLTAGAVKNFVIDQLNGAELDVRQDGPGTLVTRSGQIDLQDVLLLGVVFVSPGKIMPILKFTGGRFVSTR